MADNFMTYNDAVDVLTPYAEKINTIKPEPITWAAYQLLTTAQKEAKRYVITDYPSPDGYVDKLSDLEDVDIDSQTLVDGQALIYDDTNDVWKNKTIFEDSLTSTDTDKAITAKMGKKLNDEKVAKTDIVDNLTSSDATKPLSANQGRVLKGNIDDNFSGLSNVNLFLNPFFTVNQRGFTSAIASSIPQGFIVDMWKSYYESSGGAGVVSKNTNGLHFQPVGGTNGGLRLMQSPQDPTIFSGKTLTFSVLYAKGNSTNFEYLSGTLTNFDPSIGGHFFYASDNGYITAQYVPAYTSFFIVISQECTIKAVKLELGSVSTLANDVEPNYTSELLKCQRYFYRIKANAASTWLSQCLGIDLGGGSTIARTALFTPVEMNGTPTITIGGTAALYDTTYHTISSITVKSKAANYISVDCATSGTLTAGKLYSLYLANANDYIDLTAN